MARIEIIDTNKDNIHSYGFCGYSNPENQGHIAKSNWLKKRYDEGLKLRILQSDTDGSVGMIEYISGGLAWRGVSADGYMFIHCLMINKSTYKGKGYGAKLLECCIADAKKAKLLGVAVMTSQGTWMAGKELFLGHGFEVVDSVPPRFDLLALKFRNDAPPPAFSGTAGKIAVKYKQGLTIFWSDQCPYIRKSIADVSETAKSFDIIPTLVELKDCKSVQRMPNPYGTYCMIYNGKIVADHPISSRRFLGIMKKA